MIAHVLALAVVFQGPPESTSRITTAHDWVVRLGRNMGDSIWPGFRPDTIPVLYVVRGQGTLLLGWHGDLPPGFLPIAADPGAAPRGESMAGAGWQSSADHGAGGGQRFTKHRHARRRHDARSISRIRSRV